MLIPLIYIFMVVTFFVVILTMAAEFPMISWNDQVVKVIGALVLLFLFPTAIIAIFAKMLGEMGWGAAIGIGAMISIGGMLILGLCAALIDRANGGTPFESGWLHGSSTVASNTAVSNSGFLAEYKTPIQIEADRIKKEAQEKKEAEEKIAIEAEKAAAKEVKRRKSKKEKAEDKKRQAALEVARHNRKVAQQATTNTEI